MRRDGSVYRPVAIEGDGCASTSRRHPAAGWGRGTSRGPPLYVSMPRPRLSGMAIEPRAMTDAERWFRERFQRTPERDALFTTLSGEPVNPPYTPHDVGAFRARVGV